MRTAIQRFSALLLLATSSGESNLVVDALLFRKGVRADHYKAKGRLSPLSKNDIASLATMPSSRDGGVERTSLTRMLLQFFLNYRGKRRIGTAVSSTVNGSSTINGPNATFVSPEHDKTREKEALIKDVVQSNYIFHDASTSGINGNDSDVSKLVAAFEEVEFAEGFSICKQGDLDDTNYLYIIYEGDCSIVIDGKQLVEPYGTMHKGSVVGDMAMIYDAPRAATVTALTAVKAFRLHRDVYNSFLESKGSDAKERLRKELKEIDAAIDRIAGVKSEYEGDIIPQFKPDRSWLLRQWEGTILQQAWKPAFWNMAMSALFIYSFRFGCNNIVNEPITWSIGKIPDKDHYFVSRLLGVSKLWHTVLGLVTFVLTFFLSQAYALWKTIYGKGRELQGNLNDISLTAACRAERDPETGKYTPRAKKALEDVASSIRLYNTLAWSSVARRYNILLAKKGMSRMLSRGVMNKTQYDILTNLPPNASLPETVLQWIFVRLMKGIDEGIFPKTRTVEDIFTGRPLELRKILGGIRSSLLGKIPLAYAHFVQFLVDCFLALAPVALYPELGFCSIPAAGLLNLFYGGLLNLSKILMFPLENNDCDFTKTTGINMDIGVLIRESNVGANRYKSAIDKLPF